MAKTPDNEDLDLSSFTQKYTSVREERDMLRSQLSDLEKSHAVSEHRVESLEQEVQTLRAQNDHLKANIVEKETIIQSIASALVTHLNKDKKNNGDILARQPGVPARPKAEWMKPLDKENEPN